jgi:hypothetical protein
MEDIKLGRQTQSYWSYTQVGVASIEVAPADLKRRSLMFSTKPSFGAVSEVTFTTDNPAIPDNGIMLSGYNHPLILTVEEYGDAVQRSWYAISSAGTVPVAALSASLPRD